jgi:tripartite-type tricarboxylate transporter receptor subunit TctC
METPRRKFLQLAGASAAASALSDVATAQMTYPTRPITMIVPFVAGGALDVLGRRAAASGLAELPAQPPMDTRS